MADSGTADFPEEVAGKRSGKKAPTPQAGLSSRSKAYSAIQETSTKPATSSPLAHDGRRARVAGGNFGATSPQALGSIEESLPTSNLVIQTAQASSRELPDPPVVLPRLETLAVSPSPPIGAGVAGLSNLPVDQTNNRSKQATERLAPRKTKPGDVAPVDPDTLAADFRRLFGTTPEPVKGTPSITTAVPETSQVKRSIIGGKKPEVKPVSQPIQATNQPLEPRKELPEVVLDFGYSNLFTKGYNIRENAEWLDQIVKKMKEYPYPPWMRTYDDIDVVLQKHVSTWKEFWRPTRYNPTQKQNLDHREAMLHVLKSINVDAYGQHKINRCVHDEDIPDIIRFLILLSKEYSYRTGPLPNDVAMGEPQTSEYTREQLAKHIETCVRFTLETFLQVDDCNYRTLNLHHICQVTHKFREKIWYTQFSRYTREEKQAVSSKLFSQETKKIHLTYRPNSRDYVNLTEYVPVSGVGCLHLRRLSKGRIRFDGLILRQSPDEQPESSYVWPAKVEQFETEPPIHAPPDEVFQKGRVISNDHIKGGNIQFTEDLYFICNIRTPELPVTDIKAEKLEITFPLLILLQQYSRHFAETTHDIFDQSFRQGWSCGEHVAIAIARCFYGAIVKRFELPEQKDLLRTATLSRFAGFLYEPIANLIEAIHLETRIDHKVMPDLNQALNKCFQHYLNELVRSDKAIRVEEGPARFTWDTETFVFEEDRDSLSAFGSPPASIRQMADGEIPYEDRREKREQQLEMARQAEVDRKSSYEFTFIRFPNGGVESQGYDQVYEGEAKPLSDNQQAAQGVPQEVMEEKDNQPGRKEKERQA